MEWASATLRADRGATKVDPMTPPAGNRVLLITGLWVPLIGHAPTDGHALAARLAERYPLANVTWHSWWSPPDAASLAKAAPTEALADI